MTDKELGKINCKTLIVNGDEDIVPIQEAEYIAKSIPNSKLIILKDETHVSYLMRIKWYDKLKVFIEDGEVEL